MNFTNIFSNQDIEYLLTLPEVVAAAAKLSVTGSSNQVYFNISLTDTLRAALTDRLGLDLSAVSKIPMRWITGDTAPHVDVGSSAFENTYLVYINDNPGEFLLDTTAYPIVANTAFVFNEGISHRTLNTGTVPRLLVGPMNEFASPVGDPVYVHYYENMGEADIMTGSVASSDYTIISWGGYTSWLISPIGSFAGLSPTDIVYNVGDTLNPLAYNGAAATYSLYPASEPAPAPAPADPLCFVEGTRVLTNNGYKAIETLLVKDLIVTSDNRIMDYRLKKLPFPATDSTSAPYCIEAGAFGPNKPSATICLSPTHKIQLRKGVWISPERAAKTNPKVKQYGMGEPVNYWHIACDNYLKDDLICEGLVVESLATNKNYDGPSKVYTWNDRLGGFTRLGSGASSKSLSK